MYDDEEILQVMSPVDVEDSSNITSKELHEYTPYTSSFDYNDEIRIALKNKDAFTLPCESYIFLYGKVQKDDGTAGRTPLNFVNNGLAFLFSEIRYEINGVAVDWTRNPGIASTMKGLAWMSEEERIRYQNAAWTRYEKLEDQNNWLIQDDSGDFWAHIPLKLLLGFAEDHTRIMVGASQELVLIRSRNDKNCLLSKEAATTVTPSHITLQRISWFVPHVRVKEKVQLALSQVMNKNTPIPINFMRWELHEMPNVQQTDKFLWSIKTSLEVEAPKCVLFALQCGRADEWKMDATQFDRSDAVRTKLYLNDEFYPYTDIATLGQKYDMFKNFERIFLKREPISAITKEGWATLVPIIVFDCSKRPQNTMSSTIDIRIECDYQGNLPAKTTAYCLILSKMSYEYMPLSGIVRKV